VATPTVKAAVTPAATVDPISTLVSLPFQNYITIQEAVAGALGGADGLGANGAKSLQGLPAIVYQAITQPTTTSNLQTLGASLQTALGTEATALQNLATLPQRLITTDVSALSGLSSVSTAASPLKADALAPTTKTETTVTPTAKRVSLPGLDTPTPPKVNTTTTPDSVADPGADGEPVRTKPAAAAKKTGIKDNPVSNAVKALNKAAKDAGYTGKHRADDAKSSKSDDSKGSKGKSGK
jgi:hypothetical protein